MDLGSLFLVFALLIVVALYVSRPFWEDRGGKHFPGKFPTNLPDVKQQELSSLLAERDRILNSLQELDFDHTMGKIPEEDYPVQRVALVKSGAEILRRLDGFQVDPVHAVPIMDHEARLEAAVTARGEGAGTRVAGIGRRNRAGVPDDALERQIAVRRRERLEKAAGFCPQCGNPVQKSDAFCPKCGTRI